MTIRAPIDGTILQMNAKLGELASPSAPQPLVVLGDISGLRVRAELDERDFGEIKVGQQVMVRPAAFRGREFAGAVSFIAPLVEQGRNSRGQRNVDGRRCRRGPGVAERAGPAGGRHEGRRLFPPGRPGNAGGPAPPVTRSGLLRRPFPSTFPWLCGEFPDAERSRVFPASSCCVRNRRPPARLDSPEHLDVIHRSVN